MQVRHLRGVQRLGPAELDHLRGHPVGQHHQVAVDRLAVAELVAHLGEELGVVADVVGVGAPGSRWPSRSPRACWSPSCSAGRGSRASWRRSAAWSSRREVLGLAGQRVLAGRRCPEQRQHRGAAEPEGGEARALEQGPPRRSAAGPLGDAPTAATCRSTCHPDLLRRRAHLRTRRPVRQGIPSPYWRIAAKNVRRVGAQTTICSVRTARGVATDTCHRARWADERQARRRRARGNQVLDEVSKRSSSSCSRTDGAPTPRSARSWGSPRPRSGSGCSGSPTPA